MATVTVKCARIQTKIRDRRRNKCALAKSFSYQYNCDELIIDVNSAKSCEYIIQTNRKIVQNEVFTMGWFGSEEISNNITTSAHDTLQTVAVAIIAVVILVYGLLKIFNSHNKNQSARVATAAVRLHAVNTNV